MTPGFDELDPPPPGSKVNAEEGRQYWQSQGADVNGMLGGYPTISRVDLRGSRAFLAKMGIGKSAGLRKVDRILEGGAGIGRITQGLLIDVAEVVDVVEPIAKFTEDLQDQPGVGNVYNFGLEDWHAAEGTSYDVIWNQWCLGHLTDDHLVEYLQRCAKALTRDETGKVTGFIVVKENLTSTGLDDFDDVDSSVTRHDGSFKEIFERAGLKVVRTELQNGFPKGLFAVRMYALKPLAQ